MPAHEELDRDVVLLTGALRTAIAELAGSHVTAIVDRAVADATAARRAGTAAAVGRTRAAIDALAAGDLTLLVRALGHELHLANLAEQVHRLRRRRQRGDDVPPPESVADAVAHLRAAGVADGEIRRAAREDVHLELVLTAHPTEAARRTFLQSQLRLAGLLNELDAPYLSGTRRSDIAAAIAEEATILWLSDDVRSIRPTVDDEIRQGLWFFEKSLIQAAAELAGEWHRNLPDAPPPIAFRSWIGGDQDGNPNAGPDDVTRALVRSRTLVVAHYRHEVRELSRALGLSAALAGVSPALQASIEADEAELPWVRAEVGIRNANEPYRQKLTAIWRRLDNELAGRDEPVYADASELRRDLDLIDESLRAHHGGRIADGRLAALRRTVEVFGLELTRLDLRMHAADVRTPTERARATVSGRHRPRGRRPADRVRHELAGRPGGGAGAGRRDGLCRHPLFETLTDLRACAGDRRRGAVRRAAPAATGHGHGRLLGRRQGRRVPDRPVGDPRGTAADRRWRDAGRGDRRLPRPRRLDRRAAARPPTTRSWRGRPAIRRAAPDHRAGRDDRVQVPPARPRAPEPRGGQRRHAAVGVPRRGRSAPSADGLALMEELAATAHAAYRVLLDDPASCRSSRRSRRSELALLQLGSRPARAAPTEGSATLRAIPWVFAWTQARVLSRPGTASARRSRPGSTGPATCACCAGLPRLAVLPDDDRGGRDGAREVEHGGGDGVPRAGAARPGPRPAVAAHRRRARPRGGRGADGDAAGELLDRHPVLQRTIARRNPFVDALNAARSGCSSAGAIRNQATTSGSAVRAPLRAPSPASRPGSAIPAERT